MSSDTGDWQWHLFENLLPREILLRIVAVKGPHPLSVDCSFGWQWNNDCSFTVKSTYALRSGLPIGQPNVMLNIIQKFRGIPRVKTFLWLICRKKVITNTERTQRHFTSDKSCGICGVTFEDINHILRTCPPTLQVWNELILWMEYFDDTNLEGPPEQYHTDSSLRSSHVDDMHSSQISSN
ncbi:hypothetical protein V6N12_045620 [Hibiscus sabdariffa]|uniref:Reverse transcriptase zinc-binding domain-containing protein n=1 Tax=Hibiscus sabdariffa TaxID=183260 RepID=A0ABR2G3B2_9ROSI